ncbi:MAG: zf-TFIIB domain-containing protein [Labilithrix sp.]|nr:zf-TFIIB domain-containing protein [Labilithrix sp.]MCW5814310.1 zf-TFIIB domain-containing protein [Labilithrix sp.]
MTLGEGGSAYRRTTMRCPGCGEVMRAENVPSAEVDVCDACGGLWIDWFDGDVPTLAAEAEAARVERGTPVPPDATATRGACPRCGRALAPDVYRFPDAQPGELVAHVDLLRCEECAGSFVSRSSSHLILDRAQSPRTVGLWEAIVELLQRLVRRRI